MKKSPAGATLLANLAFSASLALAEPVAPPVNLSQPHCLEVAGKHRQLVDVMQDCAACEKAIHQPHANIVLTAQGEKIRFPRPLRCKAVQADRIHYISVYR